MDTVKNVVKKATGEESQFKPGHQVPIQKLDQPGLESELAEKPEHAQLPTEDGGYQSYKAAGKLEGKKAIITGGDSGIGRAIAILFAMEGADSTIAYLPEEQTDAEETQRRVEALGRKCYLCPGDLTIKENCIKLVEQAVEKMGGLTTVVNNCAYQNMIDDIKDLKDEQWIHTFNTNIHSFFFVSKYALPHLKRGDTIINCASINAYIGRPDLLDYTSAKGAVISFTRGLSNMKVGEGIRVNAVCPGPVWTPLIPSTMTKEAMDKFSDTPMGRAAQPSEIATCFVFLASQDSSMISGQSLHPNAGVIVNS